MKTKPNKAEPASPSSKGKVKIKNLKLNKETIENLSDQSAGAVKGGRRAGGTLAGCTDGACYTNANSVPNCSHS